MKIVVFAGSLRKGSFNKLLAVEAATLAKKLGAQVTLVDLADLAIPLYNADDEKSGGIPPGPKKLKDLMIASDGFIIASPEYNSAPSGVLKNAIDWASRPEESDPVNLAAFKNKVAAILSASPGALGGLRGLVHLRMILGNVGTIVFPGQLCVSKANSAFTPEGTLVDPSTQEKLEKLVSDYLSFVKKLS